MSKSRPLKIGYVLDDTIDSSDGVQQYVKALAKYMMDKGHDVRFLVGETEPTGGTIDRLIYSLSKNIKVSFNKNKMTMPLPGSSRKIKEVLFEEKFDVLHVQIPYSPFMGGKVIKHASKKTAIVGTFHIIGDSWIETFGTRVLRFIQARTIRRFDVIGTTSEATRRFVQANFSPQSEEIYSCLTDVSKFQDGTRLKKYDDGKVNILFLGRLVKRKGAEHLLSAVALLPDEIKSKIRVIVCGKGELAPDLQKQSEKLGLDELVEFVGFVAEEDKADYYASADIAVFPATGGESFGIVLIEAMASGTAVVLGGNNPGYSSVLNTDDLIFDPHNHQQLADLISLYASDKKKRSQMIAWQDKRIKDFSVETVGSYMLDQYNAAVEKHQ